MLFVTESKVKLVMFPEGMTAPNKSTSVKLAFNIFVPDAKSSLKVLVSKLLKLAAPSLAFNINVFKSLIIPVVVVYGNNANLRTFTLTFTSDITSGTDVTTTSYNETISLRNVDPSITTATPASGTTIQTNRYETTLATLDGVNGANNTTLRTQDLTWEILSVFNTAGSSPTTDIGPNGTNLGYFSLPTSIIPNPTNQKRAVLTNNSGGNMPPDIYNINLRLVDALNSVSATYTIDMQIIPDVVRELTWQIVCDGEQQADNFPAVEIEITDGSASPTQQNGWYIFPSTWGYLTQQFAT